MRVWLQIQGSRARSRPSPILSWRLIMKEFLRSFSSLPLNHSRRVVVSYKRKYVHEVLVNCLFELAQENVWLGQLNFPPWPKLLTWDVKQQNKQMKLGTCSILSAISVLRSVSFGVNNPVDLQIDCSATQTIYNRDNMHLTIVLIIPSLEENKIQIALIWLNCTDSTHNRCELRKRDKMRGLHWFCNRVFCCENV